MPKNIRPIRIQGNDAFVTLTRGRVAVIDADMVHMVDGGNWCAYGNGYAVRKPLLQNGKQYTILMHRALIHAPDGMCVDHIDGDKMNNRLSNLRVCTYSQNGANRGAQINNISGFKGVSASGNVWVARIKINGRLIHLGTRGSPSDAHELYKIAAKRYFGEFARAE